MYIQRIKEKEKNQVLSDFLWNKLKNSFIELDVCITRLCRYIKKESQVSEKKTFHCISRSFQISSLELFYEMRSVDIYCLAVQLVKLNLIQFHNSTFKSTKKGREEGGIQMLIWLTDH